MALWAIEWIGTGSMGVQKEWVGLMIARIARRPGEFLELPSKNDAMKIDDTRLDDPG